MVTRVTRCSRDLLCICGAFILLVFHFRSDPPDGSDFKLHEFYASDCETFEPYYGRCTYVRACVCVCGMCVCVWCVCVCIFFVTVSCFTVFLCILPGSHCDGDITNTENLQSLQEHIFKGTSGQGVHFVMGDGVSRVYGKGCADGYLLCTHCLHSGEMVE